MKTANNKPKNKYLIAVNLFLIFVLMTVAVYAWFASQSDNKVDAYDILVQSDSALELSFDGETWGGTLDLANLENSDGTKVLDTMKFVEITSNGIGSNFWIPQLTQKTNYALVNTSGTWTTAVANQDYLKFTVKMRSKDKLNVYLSSDSKAAPSSSVVTGADCGNPSTYASGTDSFSKDCVVGALRVSYNDAAGTRRIWITNPEFHLNNTVGSSTYTMTTDALSNTYSTGSSTFAEGSNFYWNKPTEHYYYNGSGTSYTCYVSNYDFYELPDTLSSVPTDTKTLLASLTTKTGDYYTGEATFVVWIEGCDTEARRALVDGKFNLSLVLDTFGVE